MQNDEQDSVRDGRSRLDEDESTDDFGRRTAAAEALPLPSRADAFSALHDELRTHLESGGRPSV